MKPEWEEEDARDWWGEGRDEVRYHLLILANCDAWGQEEEEEEGKRRKRRKDEWQSERAGVWMVTAGGRDPPTHGRTDPPSIPLSLPPSSSSFLSSSPFPAVPDGPLLPLLKKGLPSPPLRSVSIIAAGTLRTTHSVRAIFEKTDHRATGSPHTQGGGIRTSECTDIF